jgi:long-chain acyl-CoA synthetase
VQTHGNHLANIAQAVSSGLIPAQCRLFLFLPLAHALARLAGYLGFVSGLELAFPAISEKPIVRQDSAVLIRTLKEAAPHLVMVVPRFLEKIREGLNAQPQGSGIKYWLPKICIKLAEAYATACEEQGRCRWREKILLWLLSPVRAAIKGKLFGARLKYLICGGAKCPTAVLYFFEALGIEVLEGYGLTETCVAVAANRPGAKKIGSAGQLFSREIEAKVSPEGELLWRGPNVSPGYHNQPEATRRLWDDQGFFHSGDLGYFDREGFLYITGRKKELLVTSGGKKIAPEKIESLLQQSPYIAHAVLYGEDKPFCVALLSLRRKALEAWSRAQKIASPVDFAALPGVQKLIWQEVGKVNAKLASFETIKKFTLWITNSPLKTDYSRRALRLNAWKF